jgi:beta-xylosidase
VDGNRAYVGVRVYTSSDLLSWTNAGVALAVSSDAAHELAAGCIIERPKVIYNSRTGKFVMWFHLEPSGAGYKGARSGVAVADSPAGPYRYSGSMRPNAGVWPRNVPESEKRVLADGERERIERLKLTGGPHPEFPRDRVFRRDHLGGQMARDMTLFVDDDGSAYHVYASEENGTLHLSQLSDDYLRPSGNYVRVFPGEFREAPAIMKRRDRYFLFTSGCTGWKPNPLKVAVADSIWGPWEDLGNPCVGIPEEIATTFESQPTYVLPVAGERGAFIFMADRWRPQNAIDGRYVWLPINFENERPVIQWPVTKKAPGFPA